jgi:hypothetical protein
MVICPVAIAVGCQKCPIVRVCPAKSLIGNHKPDPDATQPLPEQRTPKKTKKK